MKDLKNSMLRFLLKVVLSVLVLLSFASMSKEVKASPGKWFKSGSHPKEYEMGGDPFSNIPDKAAYVKYIGKDSTGFGTWMTRIEPGKYLNKRVKLSVSLKTENVKKWASMWMRVDGKDQKMLSFDNMEERPLSGTMDWHGYEIVLDVPDNSIGVFYGVMLIGTGQVFAKKLQLDIVDETTEITGIQQGMIYLENGNYKKAVQYFERMFAVKDQISIDKYYSIWYYIALAETGKKDKGTAYLKDFVKTQEEAKWPTNIARFLIGELSEKDFFKAAGRDDAKLDNENKCEAYFYMGMVRKFNNDSVKAKEYFEKAVETNVTEFVEYGLAKFELKRMEL